MTNINLLPEDERQKDEEEYLSVQRLKSQTPVRYLAPDSGQGAASKPKIITSQGAKKSWWPFQPKPKIPPTKAVTIESASRPAAEAAKKLPAKIAYVKQPTKPLMAVKLNDFKLPKPLTVEPGKPKAGAVRPVSWWSRLKQKYLAWRLRRREIKVRRRLTLLQQQSAKKLLPVKKSQPAAKAKTPPANKVAVAVSRKPSLWWLWKNWQHRLGVKSQLINQPVVTAVKSPLPTPPANKFKKPELEVNLIPTEILEQISPRRKILSFIAILLVTVSFCGLIYFILDWYQTKKLAEVAWLTKELAATENKIAVAEPDKFQALAWQQRLDVVTKLVPQHVYWTNFFQQLERYSLPNVYFTGFAGDISSKLTLNAIAPDLWTVAKQLAVFQHTNDFATQVATHSITTQTSAQGNIVGYNFNLELTLAPNLFIVKEP